MKRLLLVLLMVAGATTALVPQPPAGADVTTGALGYTAIGSNSPGGPAYGWVDTTTGTVVRPADGAASVRVTLPFRAGLLRGDTDVATVHRDGYVELFDGDGGQATLTPYAATIADAVVRSVTTGTTPHRSWTVSWDGTVDGTTPVSLELTIEEDSSRVLVQYASITAARTRQPSTSPVGLSAWRGSGSYAVTYSATGQNLTDGSAVLFHQPGLLGLTLPAGGIVKDGVGVDVALPIPFGPIGYVGLRYRLHAPGLTTSNVHLVRRGGSYPPYTYSPLTLTSPQPGVVVSELTPPLDLSYTKMLLSIDPSAAEGTLAITTEYQDLPAQSSGGPRIAARRTTWTSVVTSAPSAPSITRNATTHPGSATMEWTQPSNGGVVPVGYTLRAHPTGAPDASGDLTAETTALQGEITGLADFTSYDFSVTATTSKGSATVSTGTNTPYPFPEAPTLVDVRAGGDAIDLRVAAPADPRWFDAAEVLYAVGIELDWPERPWGWPAEVSYPGPSWDYHLPAAYGQPTHVRARFVSRSGPGPWSDWSGQVTPTVSSPDVFSAGSQLADGTLRMSATIDYNTENPQDHALTWCLTPGATPAPPTCSGTTITANPHYVDTGELPVPATGGSWTFTAFHIAADGTYSPAGWHTIVRSVLTPGFTSKTVSNGDTVSLTATLDHLGPVLQPALAEDPGAVTVDLYRRTGGQAAWVAVRQQIEVDPAGRVAVSGLAPVLSTRYQWRFHGGPASVGDVVNVDIDVSPDLTAAFKPNRIARGASSKLWGKLTPAHAGGTVWLQKYVSGTWKSTTTSARVRRQALPNGTTAVGYVLPVSGPAVGSFRYRTLFKGDDTGARATSTTETLTVR
jgi:hypothetical protein